MNIDNEKAWKSLVTVFTDPEGEVATLGVIRKCHCGRFTKKGELWTNLNGDVKLKGWECKIHGEIQPHYFGI